jgi:hypothetical protein
MNSVHVRMAKVATDDSRFRDHYPMCGHSITTAKETTMGDKYETKARAICTEIFKQHEQDCDFTNEQFRREVEAATQNKAIRRLCYHMFPDIEIDW